MNSVCFRYSKHEYVVQTKLKPDVNYSNYNLIGSIYNFIINNEDIHRNYITLTFTRTQMVQNET